MNSEQVAGQYRELRLLLAELAVLGGDEVVERRVLSSEMFNDGGDLLGDAVTNSAEVFGWII